MNKLKRKFNLLLIATVGTALITSCGGGSAVKAEYELAPDGVMGGMKEYIEIVPGSYKLTVKNESKYNKELTMIIKLKSIQTTDKVFQEVINTIMGPLEIQLLDANGNPPAFGGTLFYDEGRDKLEKLLKNGEENFFAFTGGFSEGEMDNVELSKFVLNTNATEFDETTTGLSGEGDSETDGENIDCDQFIKDYEAFVNTYVKVMKKYKADPTNPDVLMEFTDVSEKALEMDENSFYCDDEKYADKLIELATKMAEAAM